MRAKDADRFTGLNQQRLIRLEVSKRINDGIETFPVARCFAYTAVHDQILRPFSNLWVEVIHQHPERRFGEPTLGRKRRAGRRFNGSFHWRKFSSCTTSAEVVRDRPGGV